MIQIVHIDIEKLVNEAIPIYAIKNPNPKSGKEDCPVTKREKEHFRKIMEIKLKAAKDKNEIEAIVEKYKSLFSEK
jgi:hypothetical protein